MRASMPIFWRVSSYHAESAGLHAAPVLPDPKFVKSAETRSGRLPGRYPPEFPAMRPPAKDCVPASSPRAMQSLTSA